MLYVVMTFNLQRFTVLQRRQNNLTDGSRGKTLSASTESHVVKTHKDVGCSSAVLANIREETGAFVCDAAPKMKCCRITVRRREMLCIWEYIF